MVRTTLLGNRETINNVASTIGNIDINQAIIPSYRNFLGLISQLQIVKYDLEELINDMDAVSKILPSHLEEYKKNLSELKRTHKITKELS